jgi:integrase
MSAEVFAVPLDDVRELLAGCTDERYTVAILLAAEAGLRIGEIRGLQWGDIRDGWITIRRSVDTRNNVTAPKHNKSRKVPLSPALATALATLPKLGLWVITSTQSRRAGNGLGYWAMLEKLHAIYDAAGVKVPVSETGSDPKGARCNRDGSVLRSGC